MSIADPYDVRIYTDGSANPSLQTGSYAATLFFPRCSEQHSHGISTVFGTAHPTTINRMELSAFNAGLSFLRDRFAQYTGKAMLEELNEWTRRIPPA